MRYLPNGRNTVDKIRRQMCCPFTSHGLINLSVGSTMRETAGGFASELCQECNVSLHVGRSGSSCLRPTVRSGGDQKQVMRGTGSDDSRDLGCPAEPQRRSRRVVLVV